MTKRFATPVDVCDHLMPSWLTWDLLAMVPSEKCQALNHKGASKYRISDGKNAMEVWVILDLEGHYRRASKELEVELDNLYCSHHPSRKQSAVANPAVTNRLDLYFPIPGNWKHSV
ncbi:MAG: hypothetical protein QNJ46_29035 [Leptolyngbyaceae cyanobacterium MO_188.B28]|nr:hypothetical protein [Leptolyngbyaceae cyanobacterium MO_188.B28]